MFRHARCALTRHLQFSRHGVSDGGSPFFVLVVLHITMGVEVNMSILVYNSCCICGPCANTAVRPWKINIARVGYSK
jgi:hypothetical protein